MCAAGSIRRRKVIGVVRPGFDFPVLVDCRHLYAFLSQQRRIGEDALGNQVRRDDIQGSGGDDERNVRIGVDNLTQYLVLRPHLTHFAHRERP